MGSDKVLPVPVPPLALPSAGAASDAEVRRRSRRLTRRSFAVGTGAFLAGLAGWQWLRTRPDEDGIPWPLRRVLRFNESLGQAIFREAGLAPTFDLSRAASADEMRINGHVDLGAAGLDATWSLRVEDDAGRKRRFRLDEIRQLPRIDLVTQLKCVEGWSQVLWWAGASLRELLVRYRLGTRSGAAPDPAGNPGDLYRYVGMETPDGGYYVGLDMASALHPQTLLCYEMGGRPLTTAHGAPLRLAMPVKYGYKNIKRIGVIRFSDERPPDYWAERGYDWYAGL